MAVIRPYAPADLDEVLDVWYRASQVGHPFLSEAFLAEERQRIAEQWLPASETSVFEEAGHVVGWIAMVGNEVGGLFVAPAWHRRGVGRRLLDHVRGSRPALVLTVFEANVPARAFYESYGFEVAGREDSEVEGQVELRMQLRPGVD